MTNSHLFSAAQGVADVIDGINQLNGELWTRLTCFEANAFADLLMAAGRDYVAAALIFEHAYADDHEGDEHTEIGVAAQSQAHLSGIEYAEREGYRLALAYVRDPV